MIFITLLSIAVLVVSPSVTMMMRRDREQELLFRGKQYAQAILNFQKRQGRFPLKLAELMKTQPRSARKLFKEPICNCDDWGLIRVGQPWPPPPITSNPADDGMFGGSTSASTTSTETPSLSNPGGGQQTRPGSPVPNTYTTPPPGGGGFNAGNPPGGGNGAGSGGAGGPGDASGGLDLGGNQNPQTNVPIIGVYSKVHQKGLQTFHGQEYYDTWGFIAGANNDPDVPGTQFQNPVAMFPNLRSSTSAPGGSTGPGGGGTPPPKP